MKPVARANPKKCFAKAVGSAIGGPKSPRFDQSFPLGYRPTRLKRPPRLKDQEVGEIDSILTQVQVMVCAKMLPCGTAAEKMMARRLCLWEEKHSGSG
jgi:hypothetical protein